MVATPLVLRMEPERFHLDGPRHLVRLATRLRIVARWAAGGSFLIGVLVLFGYTVGWRAAVILHPSLPPMYVTTALGFVIGSVAAVLAARPGRRARLAATIGFGLVGGYGALTLVLHLVDAGPTWFDLWPAGAVVAPTTPVPGRPVAETCVAFACIGTSGWLFAQRRAPHWAQGLGLGSVTVGAAAIFGYVLGVDRRALGGSFVAVGMALHTAVALALLGTAVMLAQPTVGLFGRLTHSGPSAQMSRRLIGMVVGAPMVLTAVPAVLARWLPDLGLAQSISAVGQVLVLGLLVMVPLNSADRMESAATETLREARKLVEGRGEREHLIESIRAVLLEPVDAPDGWDVGMRQEVAFAALPGDSCQLLSGGDDRWLLALIDVAGHGTAPALQALRLRNEVATLWRAGHGVGDIVGALDWSALDLGTIATGLFLSIDVTTGECEHINAGHPALIVAAGGNPKSWDPTGPLLGLGNRVWEPERRHIDRGTFLLAYTDGLTEARASDRTFLGDGALHGALRHHASTGAQAIADASVDAALGHSSTRLADDALVVVLHRR